MRIIAGKYKGRSLQYPKNRRFRPTQDRVKESIFNILQKDIEEKHVLDLCSGTGGLGLEALSRGAKTVTFVDIDLTYTNKNCQSVLDESDFNNVTAIQSPINRFLRKCDKQYGLIFIDPPWDNSSLYDQSLMGIFEFDILEDNGLIICEHSKAYQCQVNHFIISKTYQYGSAILTILKKK